MSITFTCLQCGREYNVGDELAGRKVPCKNCGEAIQIPGRRLDGGDSTGSGVKPGLDVTQRVTGPATPPSRPTAPDRTGPVSVEPTVPSMPVVRPAATAPKPPAATPARPAASPAKAMPTAPPKAPAPIDDEEDSDRDDATRHRPSRPSREGLSPTTMWLIVGIGLIAAFVGGAGWLVMARLSAKRSLEARYNELADRLIANVNGADEALASVKPGDAESAGKAKSRLIELAGEMRGIARDANELESASPLGLIPRTRVRHRVRDALDRQGRGEAVQASLLALGSAERRPVLEGYLEWQKAGSDGAGANDRISLDRTIRVTQSQIERVANEAPAAPSGKS
jgi:DNA-directed RNA polymerase subunit RPC12/RpoP